jgi:hypothetical protein
MKKTLVALLSVMALLVFTASAFALHQVTATEYTPGAVKAAGPSHIELGGSIRVRGEVTSNTGDFDSEVADNKQAYDERVRLGLKATVSKNTMGYLELESGDNTHDTWTWGDGSSAGTSGIKRGTMAIRQAYIATQGSGLLGTMSGIKAGHMLLALGNNLFFDHTKFGDDALLLWTTVGGGELSLIDIKFAENTTTENDDTDGLVLAYGTALNGVNLSGDVTLVRGHDKSTYDKGTNLWNIGLRGDAKVADIKVMADVELQAGKNKEDASGGELKHSGYAFMLGAEAKLGEASVRLKGAYGSGDAEDDDKDKAFNTFLSDQQNYTYIYEYKAVSAAGIKNHGLTNTWYINAGASGNATPDLKVSGDLYLLRASKISDDAFEDSKNMGWELDGKAEYKIDSNLVYFVEGGILFPGDGYKNVTESDEDPDNAWGVRHGIMLTF